MNYTRMRVMNTEVIKQTSFSINFFVYFPFTVLDSKLNYQLFVFFGAVKMKGIALIFILSFMPIFGQRSYTGDQQNVFGQPLKLCSLSPLTGWTRQGVSNRFDYFRTWNVNTCM